MKKPKSDISMIQVLYRNHNYVYSNNATDTHSDAVLEVTSPSIGVLRFDFNPKGFKTLHYPEHAIQCVLDCYRERLQDIATLPVAYGSSLLKMYHKRIALLQDLLKVNLAIVAYNEDTIDYQPEYVEDAEDWD